MTCVPSQDAGPGLTNRVCRETPTGLHPCLSVIDNERMMHCTAKKIHGEGRVGRMGRGGWEGARLGMDTIYIISFIMHAVRSHDVIIREHRSGLERWELSEIHYELYIL